MDLGALGVCRRTPGHAQLPSQGLWQQIAASLPSLDCKTSKMSDSGHLRMVKQCQTKHVLQLQGRCRDSSGFSYAGWFAMSKVRRYSPRSWLPGPFPGPPTSTDKAARRTQAGAMLNSSAGKPKQSAASLSGRSAWLIQAASVTGSWSQIFAEASQLLALKVQEFASSRRIVVIPSAGPSSQRCDIESW